MACELPFDFVSIGGTPCDTDGFVYGSSSLDETGNDIATTTADNKIHNDRQSLNTAFSFECYGDQESLTSPAGCSEAIIVKQGGSSGTTVASFNGIATAVFNEASNTTAVSIAGDPT